MALEEGAGGGLTTVIPPRRRRDRPRVPPSPPVPPPPRSQGSRLRRTRRIARGESLIDIAAGEGIDMGTLLAANPGVSFAAAGTLLNLPSILEGIAGQPQTGPTPNVISRPPGTLPRAPRPPAPEVGLFNPFTGQPLPSGGLAGTLEGSVGEALAPPTQSPPPPGGMGTGLGAAPPTLPGAVAGAVVGAQAAQDGQQAADQTLEGAPGSAFREQRTGFLTRPPRRFQMGNLGARYGAVQTLPFLDIIDPETGNPLEVSPTMHAWLRLQAGEQVSDAWLRRFSELGWWTNDEPGIAAPNYALGWGDGGARRTYYTNRGRPVPVRSGFGSPRVAGFGLVNWRI